MTAAPRTLLKSTTSRCPLCHQPCPAEVWKTDESPSRVLLSRTCGVHGETTNCISSDARFYWLATGSDTNRGESPCGEHCACSADPGGAVGTLGKNAFAEKNSTVEKLSTCLALIEIVDSCNLACPTCFADSPVGIHSQLQYHSLASLQQRIDGVIDRKGHIEILQLSGGEPTLHPEFFALLDWCRDHPGIDYVLVNTNGVRIAKDDAFLAGLAERAPKGHLQLYLQFDGLQDEGQQELRGADLRGMKKTCMERCASIRLPVTLAMTVNQHNLGHVWNTIEWGLRFDNCRGVAFQPMFHSGRLPEQTPAAAALNSRLPLNTADIILAAVDQAGGRLKFDDFTPLPCGDPNCATIGYLLKTPLGTRSVSDFVDFTGVQDFLRDKVRYRIEDLVQCGCDNTALGDMLKSSRWRKRTPSASSSSPSWMPGPGTRTASTAAAPTSSAPTARSIPSAATTPASRIACPRS